MSNFVANNDMTRKPRFLWTPRHTEILRRMAAVGYTDREIANVTGHRRETVTRHRLALGLPASHRVDWIERQTHPSSDHSGHLEPSWQSH